MSYLLNGIANGVRDATNYINAERNHKLRSAELALAQDKFGLDERRFAEAQSQFDEQLKLNYDQLKVDQGTLKLNQDKLQKSVDDAEFERNSKIEMAAAKTLVTVTESLAGLTEDPVAMVDDPRYQVAINHAIKTIPRMNEALSLYTGHKGDVTRVSANRDTGEVDVTYADGEVRSLSGDTLHKLGLGVTATYAQHGFSDEVRALTSQLEVPMRDVANVLGEMEALYEAQSQGPSGAEATEGTLQPDGEPAEPPQNTPVQPQQPSIAPETLLRYQQLSSDIEGLGERPEGAAARRGWAQKRNALLQDRSALLQQNPGIDKAAPEQVRLAELEKERQTALEALEQLGNPKGGGVRKHLESVEAEIAALKTANTGIERKAVDPAVMPAPEKKRFEAKADRTRVGEPQIRSLDKLLTAEPKKVTAEQAKRHAMAYLSMHRKLGIQPDMGQLYSFMRGDFRSEGERDAHLGMLKNNLAMTKEAYKAQLKASGDAAKARIANTAKVNQDTMDSLVDMYTQQAYGPEPTDGQKGEVRAGIMTIISQNPDWAKQLTPQTFLTVDTPVLDQAFRAAGDAFVQQRGRNSAWFGNDRAPHEAEAESPAVPVEQLILQAKQNEFGHMGDAFDAAYRKALGLNNNDPHKALEHLRRLKAGR